MEHVRNTEKRVISHIGRVAYSFSWLVSAQNVLNYISVRYDFHFLTFELIRFRAPGINRWFSSFFKPLLREKEVSRLTGASYMLTASLIAFLLFPRDIAVLTFSFLAIGDPVAIIVGRWIGKRKLLGKTLEGDLACFISCVTIVFVFYYAGLNILLLTILAGSVGATIVEAVPIPINDNLTMPLFAGVVIMIMQF